jgi:hypothetical protein
MRLLARARGSAEAPRRPRGLDRDREIRLLVGQHGEIALEAMRQRKVAIGREHLGKARCHIGAIFQIAQHRAVERGRRLRRGRRNRQSMDVAVHLSRPGCG